MRHPFYPSSFISNGKDRDVVLVGLACLIVGVTVGWIGGMHYQKKATPEVLPEEDITMSTTTTTSTLTRDIHVYEGESESIEVTNQQAGSKVAVAAVALSHPGWVAVREEEKGEGGKILGARWFPEGEHEGIVELLRATKPGSRYHAYLFLDNGDRKFDPHADTPITHNGLLILKPFTTY